MDKYFIKMLIKDMSDTKIASYPLYEARLKAKISKIKLVRGDLRC